jgi:hypothetical protein
MRWVRLWNIVNNLRLNLHSEMLIRDKIDGQAVATEVIVLVENP